MKLIRLTLTNFKGIRSFTLEPNGQNVSIYADNGVGKTTLADAFYWLLFGKDSLNRTDFEIKTIDPSEGTLHGLEHTVEAVFETDRGNLTLAKVYKEDWVRERGAADRKFKGHTTDHFVNDVPVQKKDYDSRVLGLCDEKTFRLLTDPTYFSEQLKWQDRRQKLLEICGDVSDQMVIDANPKLADLPGLMGAHALDDFRKVLVARRTKINDELKTLPVRIDETTRSMPAEASAVDPLALETDRQQLRALQERRATAAAGGEIAEKTLRLRQIEGELLGIANNLRSSGSEERDRTAELIRAKDREIRDAEGQGATWVSRIKLATLELESLQDRIEAKRQEYRAVSATAFDPGSGLCHACGQVLPPDKVDSAQADFNEAKAKSLAEIQAAGESLRALLDEQEAKLNQAKTELATVEQQLTALRAERAAMTVPAAQAVDLEQDPAYQAKLREKADVESALDLLRTGASSALQEIDQAIASVQARITEAQSKSALAVQREQAKQRIKELNDRQRQLGEEIEGVERAIFLSEEFVRTKVSMLTERINSRFTIARFQLFEDQINEGLRETCIVAVGGVPYGSLNNATRVNAGLDIINTLAEDRGFAPPIFIDGAESVTSIIATRGQQIRLVVSRRHKTLTVLDQHMAEAADRLNALIERALADGLSEEDIEARFLQAQVPAQGALLTA